MYDKLYVNFFKKFRYISSPHHNFIYKTIYNSNSKRFELWVDEGDNSIKCLETKDPKIYSKEIPLEIYLTSEEYKNLLTVINLNKIIKS